MTGRHTWVALVAISAALAVLPAETTATAAGPDSCGSTDKCVSNWYAGSIYYGWSANVPRFADYSFSDGTVVNNNIGYARDRDTYWDNMCIYDNINYGLLNDIVTSTNWVLVARSGSSYKAHTSATSC